LPCPDPQSDRAAQSNLITALTEAKALFQNGQTYCEASCATGPTPLTLVTIQSSVPTFVIAEALGGVLAFLAIRLLYPGVTSSEASDIIFPHHETSRPAGAVEEKTQ